jgi:hypothetical protein
MDNAITQPVFQLITTLCNGLNETPTSRSPLTSRLITQLTKELFRLATPGKISHAQAIEESLRKRNRQLTEQFAKQLHQLRNIATSQSPLEPLVFLALLSTTLINATILALNSPPIPEKPT